MGGEPSERSIFFCTLSHLELPFSFSSLHSTLFFLCLLHALFFGGGRNACIVSVLDPLPLPLPLSSVFFTLCLAYSFMISQSAANLYFLSQLFDHLVFTFFYHFLRPTRTPLRSAADCGHPPCGYILFGRRLFWGSFFDGVSDAHFVFTPLLTPFVRAHSSVSLLEERRQHCVAPMFGLCWVLFDASVPLSGTFSSLVNNRPSLILEGHHHQPPTWAFPTSPAFRTLGSPWARGFEHMFRQVCRIGWLVCLSLGEICMNVVL